MSSFGNSSYDDEHTASANIVEEGIRETAPSSLEILLPAAPIIIASCCCSTCCTMVFKNVALYSPLHTWVKNKIWSVNIEKMSDIRNAGYFAAVGILFAILIIGTFALAGFKIPALRFPGFTNKGTLTVKVMDAPTELEHLNITIDQLSIQKANATDGEWIDLELIDGEPIYFDLLALQNVTLTLSRTEIPAGNYTMIKMHVLTANATKTDGSTIDSLHVPSAWIKIILKPHLNMQTGAAITITIDLEPTVNIANNPQLNLRPTMKAMVNG